jgi:transcriptional regulator with XRE-family HTH domain
MTTRELNEAIGKRIAALREQRHLTQDEFSELIGTSTKHCSAAERGVSGFSLEKLVRVSKLFDVSMDYLILGQKREETALTGFFPESILDIAASDNDDEKSVLLEYLQMYRKVRQLPEETF